MLAAIAFAPEFLGGHKPSPLDRQWSAIREAIKKQGYRIADTVQVDFHGSGTPATLLVLKPFDDNCDAQKFSDALRVYEINQGTVTQTYAFSPSNVACGSWQFDLRSASHRFSDGRQYALGAYSTDGGPGVNALSAPVVLDWNDTASKYELRNLLGSPGSFPNLVLGSNDRTFLEHQLALYDHAAQLIAAPVSVRVWGADDFVVHETADNWTIAAQYRLTAGVGSTSNDVTPVLYAFKAFWIDLASRAPEPTLCQKSKLVSGGGEIMTNRAALTTWSQQVIANGYC